MAGPGVARATAASAHRVVPATADVSTESPREHELQWVVSADHALSVVSLQWMLQAAEIEGLPLKPGWKLSARSLAMLSQKGHIHVRLGTANASQHVAHTPCLPPFRRLRAMGSTGSIAFATGLALSSPLMLLAALRYPAAVLLFRRR